MARAELANRRLQPLGHVSAKSLENIAFNVNDGSARRAKNAGVAVSGGTKEGTYAAILGQPCSLRARADFRCHADEARRQTRYDNFCSPRSSGCLPSSSIVCVTNGFGAVAGAI